MVRLSFSLSNTLSNVLLQILVTHHVELVLPGTYYLVRMLDGRIDLQGKVEDLRKSGVLEHIEQEANLEAKEEKKEEELKEEIADNTAAEVTPADGAATENGTDAKPKAKKPRKLVEDEFRETGSVKWSVYRTYLKASYANSISTQTHSYSSP